MPTVIGGGGEMLFGSEARSALCTRSSVSPNETSSGAALSSHAAATPIQSLGQIWSPHWRSPGPVRRRGTPRMG